MLVRAACDRAGADLGDVILDREARVGADLVGDVLERHLAGHHLVREVPARLGLRLLLRIARGLVARALLAGERRVGDVERHEGARR